MQSKIIKKLKSFLSYSLKLFILTSFLLSQSFIAEIFLYQNNPNTKVVNTAKADYSDHWYNTNWSYRKPITIHASEVSHTTEASQSNFPVLISLTNPDLKTTSHSGKVQNDPNGYDIIFSQDGYTQLDHEMEKYDPTTGEIVAWVKIPTLSSASDTILYIYYGNSAINATQEHKNNVWNDGTGNHFKMVQHLGGNIANGVAGHLDSTQYANNGTPNNFNSISTSTTNGTGKIAGDDVFDGTNDYVNAGNNSSLKNTIGSSNFTVEAWVNPSDWVDYRGILNKDTGGGYAGSPGGLFADTSGFHFIVADGTNANILTYKPANLNQWYHLIGVTNGTRVMFYVNGVSRGDVARTASSVTNNYNLTVGAFDSSRRYFNGFIDEVRISDIARSADWIVTEYNNQTSPSSFYSLGGEENYTQYLTPPTLAEVTPVPTPTNSTTPSYTFSSTKLGTITYGGVGCSSSTTSAVAGNNTITFNVLSSGAHSDCTIRVTDSVGNQSNLLTTTSFTIDTNVTWYNVFWPYRKQIIIDHTKVPHTGSATNLANFPILVSIANDNSLKLAPIGKVTKTDGSDILFANQAGTQLLNYEIESYDKDNGNLTAWVKIPTLYDNSTPQDTVIYLYYGNSNATANTQANINGVWDSNSEGVWHLGDTPSGHAAGDYKDSTINVNNNINTTDEPTATTAGRLGGAQSFNGTSSYIDVGNGSSLDPNTFSVEAWTYPVSTSVFGAGAVSHNYPGSSGSEKGYRLLMFTNMEWRVTDGSGVGRVVTASNPLNTWTHWVGTFDSNNVSRLYKNGVLVGSVQLTGYTPYSLGKAWIGSGYAGLWYFNGSVDEVRISDTARSADWIAAEYNNQYSPGTFYALGSEENTSPPEIVELTPVPTPTNNSVPSYTFSSTKSGVITYAGDCSSPTTSAVAGNNTITFNTLSVGIHSNCTIKIMDGLGSQSNTLPVRSFTVNNQFTVYIVPAITDSKILPKSSIASSYVSDTISAQASSGEDKATSFVVNSNANVSSLQIEVSNLTGSGNTISGTDIDVKTVKCWYQGGFGTTDYSVRGRYLTPELLLKDDSLVNVDGDNWNQYNVSNPNGKNYLKVSGSYIDISSGTQDPNSPDIIPISNRPVQDAAALQPVNLPANYNKQFWITLHVPDNTAAGDYSGTISIKNGVQIIKSININLQVLPINLPQPNVEYSMYYSGRISGNGSISSNDKTVEQYTAEQQNMREHGVTNPTFYSFGTDNNLLQELSIRRQAGIDNTNMYYVGSVAVNNIPYYKNLTAPYGVVNLYQYGPDEQSLDNPTQRSHINDIHSAGGKYFDAQSVSKADSVADVLDLAIVSGSLSHTLAANYHRYGHKVYSYANPQTVPEYPSLFRKNYGFALWQANYDGVMDYAYQSSFGDIWNDFDYNAYRDHVLAYPTMNGVIDTIEWEGFKEGVTDMRYLAALQNEIATAKNNGGDNTATEAESYLASLQNPDLANQDPDAIRSQIINYIIALKSSSHSLTVNQGTGSSFHVNNDRVSIAANTPQAGMTFDKWTGDTQYVSSVYAVSTTVTMPSHAIILVATYKAIPGYWYSRNYSYRKAITTNHTKVSNTDQSNFPVLVSLTDNDLRTVVNGGKVQNSNGYDIVFTLPDKTLLNYEIESYDGSTGKLVAWLKIPTLSASMDTFLYMYYGNGNITSSEENKAGVWDSDFKGVWHLEETGAAHVGDIKDSTSSTNNSVNIVDQSTIATGKFDKAQNFNGTSSYIDVGNGNSLKNTIGSSNFTVEAWVNPSDWVDYRGILNKDTSGGYANSPGGFFADAGGFRFIVADGTNFNILTYKPANLNQWYHLTGVTNGTRVMFYVNGVSRGDVARTASSVTNNYNLTIGAFDSSRKYFDGFIDEVRVSDVARSADWIATEYNNESSPNTFSTLSSEENLLPPTITSLSANLPNGTYGTGTTIPITINFSKDVTSTGNITLTLNTNPQRTCSFTITNNNSATCNYTIQGGDSATNLNATISGNIQDQFGNPLTNFTPLSNLSDNTTININTSSSFTPPTKPNITTIQLAANAATTIDLQSIPSNITQIAISLTPDFKGVSWIDFDRKKFSTINQTTQTLYIKFRTNEGAVSDTIIITPQSGINNTISLIDGDIIQCKSSNDPNAVYIVKIIGNKTYIRHITSIQIFNYYKHLKWENLKQVDSLTPFSLSSWIRVNTNTNGLPKAEDKVYEINGDQTKHWINMTSNQFLTHGGSDEAIYTVNAGELNLYSAGPDVVSL